ncbi:PilZ domain-containing protein [Alkalilimnicola ehrlichii]|uniref:PilZ domain-containing protein n=1 Tax=Alkalilimnicola ehrlichii TaxID=351052 RepID=UPI003BA37955
MTDPADRRRFTRVRFEAPAELEGPEGKVPVEVEDLSMKGALLAVPPAWGRTADSDARYALTLKLSEQDVVRMEVKPAHLHGSVIGFRCERIDVDSLTLLRQLLEANSGDVELIHRELEQLVAPEE